MAFTRKALKAMGLTDDQVESLIELHTESTDAIKAERDKYKEQAEKLPDVQEQLNKANSELEAAKKDDYKGKYESEKAAHDKLKSDIQTKEATEKRLKSFKEEAKKRGYSENAVSRFLDSKSYDPIEKIKYDDEGNASNYDDVFKELDSKFTDYAVKTGTLRHTPVTPPVGGKVTRSKEEIMSITDTSARQKAIAENLNLFTGKE